MVESLLWRCLNGRSTWCLPAIKKHLGSKQNHEHKQNSQRNPYNATWMGNVCTSNLSHILGRSHLVFGCTLKMHQGFFHFWSICSKVATLAVVLSWLKKTSNHRDQDASNWAIHKFHHILLKIDISLKMQCSKYFCPLYTHIIIIIYFSCILFRTSFPSFRLFRFSGSGKADGVELAPPMVVEPSQVAASI